MKDLIYLVNKIVHHLTRQTICQLIIRKDNAFFQPLQTQHTFVAKDSWGCLELTSMLQNFFILTAQLNLHVIDYIARYLLHATDVSPKRGCACSNQITVFRRNFY